MWLQNHKTHFAEVFPQGQVSSIVVTSKAKPSHPKCFILR